MCAPASSGWRIRSIAVGLRVALLPGCSTGWRYDAMRGMAITGSVLLWSVRLDSGVASVACYVVRAVGTHTTRTTVPANRYLGGVRNDLRSLFVCPGVADGTRMFSCLDQKRAPCSFVLQLFLCLNCCGRLDYACTWTCLELHLHSPFSGLAALPKCCYCSLTVLGCPALVMLFACLHRRAAAQFAGNQCAPTNLPFQGE